MESHCRSLPDVAKHHRRLFEGFHDYGVQDGYFFTAVIGCVHLSSFYTLTVIAIAGFASIDPEIKKSATAPTTPGRTLLLPSNR